MGIIKQLSPSVYNMISAGEVVERPTSVVKELVENSIDSGASKISICIEGGGLDYIEVCDNGCGIDESDIVMAFQQHATSKLSTVDELFEIQSLGFRGEALASIASVSKVCVTTRTPFDDSGVMVELLDGKAVDKNYVSYNIGTKMAVSELFYNVPARRKFLKSCKREESLVTKYVSSLILTNPTLEVNYKVDGECIFRFRGEGLEEAIHCVYKSDCIRNCLPINSTYKGITVMGYVGNPDYARPNTTYQTMSVNGRLVKDVTIASAVKQAFLPFLVGSRIYPFFVFDVKMDEQEVDVNVHPNKLEVRFADTRKVFVAVSYPIKDALVRYSQHRVQKIVASDTGEQFLLHQTAPVDTDTSSVCVLYEEKTVNGFSTKPGETEYSNEDDRRIHQNATWTNKAWLKSMEDITIADLMDMDKNYQSLTVSKPSPFIEMDYENLESFSSEMISLDKISTLDFSEIKVLGVLFDTYFVLEMYEKLIMIDQHAAHERILYDKYMSKTNDLAMQQMIFPYAFYTTAEESEFLDDNLEELKKAGFAIECFGNNSYRVTEVASMFSDCNIDKLIKTLVSEIEYSKLDRNIVLSEYFAKTACRHAAKAGDKLTDEEVKYITKQLFANKNLRCPHGRPIAVEFTKTEIEKMFKRIV